MSKNENYVNEMFQNFLGHYVNVKMKSGIEVKGNIISVDDYLNIILETEDGIRSLKGGNIVYVSAQE